MARAGLILVLLAASLAAGCSQMMLSGGGPPTVSRVDRMDLWVAPVALEQNGQPGPDGVELRVYLFQSSPGATQPGLIKAGQFQFFAYEGRLNVGTNAQPFFQWEYSADQMRPFFGADKYGLGSYHATLSWVPKIPTSTTITIIARFVDAQGRAAVSAPADVQTRAE